MRYYAMLSQHEMLPTDPFYALCIAYRLLKFRYLLPMNRKIKLLPMNAIKMPKSLHLVAKLMPKGS